MPHCQRIRLGDAQGKVSPDRVKSRNDSHLAANTALSLKSAALLIREGMLKDFQPIASRPQVAITHSLPPNLCVTLQLGLCSLSFHICKVSSPTAFTAEPGYRLQRQGHWCMAEGW